MSTLALARRRFSLWGVTAALAAAAAGLAVYSYLSWVRSQIPAAGKLVPLVVAGQDLSPGTRLEKGHLRLADHPDKYLPPAAITELDDAMGRTLAVPVFEGEALTAKKLGTRGGASSVVPGGMRAYSLGVASDLGFLPKPGDRVDVIVTLPRDVLGEHTSVTALRHREVASVGRFGSQALGEVGERLGVEDSSEAAITITLFVTPEEAQELAMAESLGRVSVVLAPVDSEETSPPSPVTPGDLGRE